MTSIHKITKREKARISLESELNHHIPTILVDQLNDLENINYKANLETFQSEYSKTKFKNIEEEYNFVKDNICELLDSTFSNPFKEGIEKAMRLAIAEANFFEAARERFIHPFQDFLLGSIIIDKFYNNFQTWFSQDLCASKNTSVEAAWLLTAIFHDRSKPLKQLKDMIAYEEGEVIVEIPEKDEYVEVLSSLHSHLADRKPLENWKPNKTNIGLSQILLEFAEADNHGVKSSFSLLRHLQKVFGENAFKPSYVEAALAVALHDQKLQSSLLEEKIFPINITMFPLPCLLLYCDATEEWGRKKEYDTEVRLVDIKIDEDSVNCEVAFDRSDCAKSKIAEFEGVMHCIQSEDIAFTFSSRIYASS
jgi:hypothetical protein